MIKAKDRSKSNQSGFTIIELVIATLVFSTVLLIATFGVIQISRTYIKGFLASETENTTRSIIDDVTQAVQLSGPGGVVINNSQSGTNWYAFCINGFRYTYQLNVKVETGIHAFMRDQPSSIGTCPPNTTWSNGTELLSTNERLVSFSLCNNSTPSPCNSPTGAADLYQINLSILYGSDDVTVNNAGKQCLDNSVGGFFCALSSTTTTVQERT